MFCTVSDTIFHTKIYVIDAFLDLLFTSKNDLVSLFNSAAREPMAKFSACCGN